MLICYQNIAQHYAVEETCVIGVLFACIVSSFIVHCGRETERYESGLCMPTVGVFAAIFDEQQRLLCVKQNYGAHHWTTPGGAIEAGESPSVALEREVREESGYLVQTGDLVGVYARPSKDDIVLFFTAHILGQEAWWPDEEITEAGFFAWNQLPTPMSEPGRIRIQDAFDGRTGVYRVFEEHRQHGS